MTTTHIIVLFYVFYKLQMHSAYCCVMNTGNSKIKFDLSELKLLSCLGAQWNDLIINLLSGKLGLSLHPLFPFVCSGWSLTYFAAFLQIVGTENYGYLPDEDLIETFWSWCGDLEYMPISCLTVNLVFRFTIMSILVSCKWNKKYLPKPTQK